MNGVFEVKQYDGDAFLKGFGGNGLLEPGELAEKIYGDKFSSASMFAYLFRRFGYPLDGWDDYKELCGYILNTPMEGIYLYISIKGDGAPSYSFGVRFSDEMYKKYRETDCRRRMAFINLAKKHALQNGYPFVIHFENLNKRKNLRIVHGWCLINGVDMMNASKEVAEKLRNDFEKSLKELMKQEAERVRMEVLKREPPPWSLEDLRKATRFGLVSKPESSLGRLLTQEDLMKGIKIFPSLKDMIECDPRSDEAKRADKLEAAEDGRGCRRSIVGTIGFPVRQLFGYRVSDMLEPKKLKVQFRFPRSKKKRIRKKWAKNEANWREEQMPKKMKVKATWLNGEWDIEAKPLKEKK